MGMTPEERLDRIEATLDRASLMYQRMNIRHAGTRILYRQGVNRFEEMLDRQEQQETSLAALMDSQIRTEDQMRHMQTAIASLTKTFETYLESKK